MIQNRWFWIFVFILTFLLYVPSPISSLTIFYTFWTKNYVVAYHFVHPHHLCFYWRKSKGKFHSVGKVLLKSFYQEAFFQWSFGAFVTDFAQQNSHSYTHSIDKFDGSIEFLKNRQILLFILKSVWKWLTFWCSSEGQYVLYL